MEFDKSKVYTALNADESLIGAKGYFADSILTLKTLVENNFKSDYQVLSDFENDCFMYNDNHIFNFFYLVEPAPEKWYVTYTKDREHFSTQLVKHRDKTDEVLFEGYEDECKQWVEEHSKPKYRPFKDCDELIETYHIKLMEKYKTSVDFTDIELPSIWVKPKKSNTLQASMITDFSKTAIDLSYTSVSLQYLFDNFTFLDGSVCGVEE